MKLFCALVAGSCFILAIFCAIVWLRDGDWTVGLNAFTFAVNTATFSLLMRQA